MLDVAAICLHVEYYKHGCCGRVFSHLILFLVQLPTLWRSSFLSPFVLYWTIIKRQIHYYPYFHCHLRTVLEVVGRLPASKHSFFCHCWYPGQASVNYLRSYNLSFQLSSLNNYNNCIDVTFVANVYLLGNSSKYLLFKSQGK